MELRHLRTFRAVARTLSFTRAGLELHYAQSSVTEQIQALEAELGKKLFDRTGRRLQLTAPGKRLLEYADEILVLVDEAQAAARAEPDAPTGDLHVGGLETLCAQRLPLVLARYRDQYPGVRVLVREGNRGELYAAVRRGEVDVCFTFGDAPADPALCSEALTTDRLVVVVPPQHRLSERAAVGVQDLGAEPFLATETGCGFREMFDRVLQPQGPAIVAEMTSLAMLCSCVASGMGCALLPEMAVVGHRARGEVATVPLDEADHRTTVTMTWLRRRNDTPTVAMFLDTARRVLAATEDPEAD